MAGFTLGAAGSTTTSNTTDHQIPHEGFFLYRSNEEITNTNANTNTNTNKGFELWQHHHHHHHQQQQQQQQQRHLYQDMNNHYFTTSSSLARRSANVSPDRVGVGVGVNMLMMRSSSQGGVSCQDCGNQAKKDCLHMRCRTCCKSRNLPCQTHVKSTWVPASRRRERQQQQLASLQQQQQQQQQQRGGRGESSSSANKRPRENMNMNMNNSSSSALACTSTTRLSSSGGLEDFPAEVSTPAVFRCVRVSSMVDDHSEDHPLQYAYQAAVNIGGHVFKGILYDQGLETHYEASSGGAAGEVHTTTTRCLMTSNAETATTTAMNVSGGGGGALIDPTSLYPTPLNAFVAGTQFFGHPRS